MLPYMNDRDDMRKIVEKGYDEGDYHGHFRLAKVFDERERRFFASFLEHIPSGGKIHDLGSGTGVPYDEYLVRKGFDVTGIDISSKHVAMARNNVPGAEFIKADFSRFDFGKNRYDAVMSLYAIFHIPREEHAGLFRRMHEGLTIGGVILVTMGAQEMEMDVAGFAGSTMAWSSYSVDENTRIVEEAGFQLLLVDEEQEQENEHHLWILAKKI